jgi:hypothetical protein
MHVCGDLALPRRSGVRPDALADQNEQGAFPGFACLDEMPIGTRFHQGGVNI